MIKKLLAVGALTIGCVVAAAVPATAATPASIPTHVSESPTLVTHGKTIDLTISGKALHGKSIPLPAGFTVQLIGHQTGKSGSKVLAVGHTDWYGRYTVKVHNAQRGWTYAAKLLPGRQMTDHYAGSTGSSIIAR